MSEVLNMDIKEVNKKITKAKRLWTNNKKLNVKVDSIDRAENSIFVDDEILAELVSEKEEKEAEIIKYIDERLVSTRPKTITPIIDKEFFKKYYDMGNFTISEGNNHSFNLCYGSENKIILENIENMNDCFHSVAILLNYFESQGIILGELI